MELRNRKSRFLSLVMVIALLAAFIPVPAVAADAAETPPVGGSVEKITVKAYDGLAATATPIDDPATKQVGDTLAVWVEAVNATQLQGVDFFLEYSKDTLEVDKRVDPDTGEESERILLGDINEVAADAGRHDAQAGTISIGVANESAADYEKAVLLKVQFKIKAEGDIYVRLQSGSLKMTTAGAALIDTTGVPIEALSFTLGTPPAVPVLTTLTLGGTPPAGFEVGDTFDLSSLTLTAADQNSDPYDLTGKTVTWASSNTVVATVYGSTLTAVDAGTTQVTATVEGVESNALAFTVSAVTPPAVPVLTTLTLDGTPPGGFTVGDTFDLSSLTLTATDQDGEPYDLAGKTVTWASSNTVVATVYGSTLTAVSAGTTQVTATVEGVTSNALTFVSWPIEVSDVRTLDQDGNPVSNFAPGNLYQVELTMTNVSEQTLTPMAIVRIERSDLLQYIGTAKVTLQSNSTATVTIGPALPVDAATGTYKAKVMVWSNWLSQDGELLAPAGEVTFTVGQ